MQRQIKISPFQLTLVIIGLVFGDFAILNPARAAMQDAWLAFIIGMAIGICIVTIYILIARLHPDKNLVPILLETFGKPLGGLLTIFYIWYFIHIASLVLRSFGEYMVNATYSETPQAFIMIALIATVVYALRKGIEVIARASEIFIPLLIVSITMLFFMLANNFQFEFLLPVLKDGIKPVLQTGFGIATFPFGELVVLLMIFPYINDKSKLGKSTYRAVIIGGMLLLSIVVRDLLVIGPNIVSTVIFPPNVSTALLPTIVLEPLIAINLLIGGACFITIYIHAITLTIAQLFGIEENKTLIIPVSIIVIGVSLWLYDSLPEMFRIAKEVYPYYSLPFQVFIPLLVLLVSQIKKRTQKQRKG